jgi:hypothetical protein
MLNLLDSAVTALYFARSQFGRNDDKMMQRYLVGFMLILVSAQALIDPANFTAALQQLPSLAQRAVNSGDVPGLAIAVVYNGTVQVILLGFLSFNGRVERMGRAAFVVIALRGKPMLRLPADDNLSTREDSVFV